uniref:Uncharacterized protein n=1 Tax=Anguilla anguilla TaxID=7936 RepID=A0A0E9TG31_ANGAN
MKCHAASTYPAQIKPCSVCRCSVLVISPTPVLFLDTMSFEAAIGLLLFPA